MALPGLFCLPFDTKLKESLHRCDTADILICKRDLDRVPAAWQNAKTISPQDARNKTPKDKIQDIKVLTNAGMQSVYRLLKLARLRWTGHVASMSDLMRGYQRRTK